MKRILFILFVWSWLGAGAVEINVLKYKPKPDGKSYCTKALQQAIDDCSAAGGGTVIVPDGVYLTGAIWIKDNVELRLSKQARLLGSTRSSEEAGDYPKGTPALINFNGVRNAALTGFGTVDGQGGDPVFDLGDNAEFKGKGRRFNNIRVYKSKDIRIEDVTLTAPGTWTLRLLQSEDIQVRGVKIYSFSNHNNDGIDIDARNVVISDCIIYSEDDALCFKSDSRSRNYIVENVTVTNCILATNCNAIKFGTSGWAGFRNIAITNCAIRRAPTHNVKDRTNFTGITNPASCEMGIALEMVDGGMMENITISNIVMRGIMTPIFVRLGARKGEVRHLKNVLISNVTAESEGFMSSSITGVPGHKVSGVTLRDIVINSMGKGTEAYALKPMPEKEAAYPQNNMFGYTTPSHGLYIRHAENITMENIQLFTQAPDMRPAIIMDDVENVWLNNFQGETPAGEMPFVKINDGQRIRISGFRQQTGAPRLFLEATGTSSSILLRDNELNGVKQPVKAADGVVTSR